MDLTAGIALFGVGWLVSSYLLYRIVRFSRRIFVEPIGRAFLSTKVVLWLMYTYVFIAVLAPDWIGRETTRWILIGVADLALVYVTAQVVKIQREKPHYRLLDQQGRERQTESDH